MVAVPTAMTALVRMPARIDGEARGSSIRRSLERGRDRRQARVGALHDREQTVKKQGDDGGHDADSQDRDEQREECQRRDRLQHACGPQGDDSDSSSLRRQDSHRDAKGDASCQRGTDQFDVPHQIVHNGLPRRRSG